MASTSVADSRLADFISAIPAPGTSAAEHLAHTVACFADMSPQRALVSGGGATLTVGHLRALALDAADRTALHALLTVLVANRDRAAEEFAVTATAGVYDRRSGLTWGDLLALATA